MKKVVLSVVAALALSAAPAFAADMPVKAVKAPAAAPSPWDVAFGAAVMNDYDFPRRHAVRTTSRRSRAISSRATTSPKDSNFTPASPARDYQVPQRCRRGNRFLCRRPADLRSARARFRLLVLRLSGRHLLQRHGSFGCHAHASPNGNVVKMDLSFYEVYAKATYTAGDCAFGPTFYYSPNFLNTGAAGDYLSAIAKYTAPASMALADGHRLVRIGRIRPSVARHQRFVLRRVRLPAGINTPTTTPGTSASASPGRLFTLDLRYSDTDLSRATATPSPAIRRGRRHVTPINPAVSAPTGAARPSSPSCRLTSRRPA